MSEPLQRAEALGYVDQLGDELGELLGRYGALLADLNLEPADSRRMFESVGEVLRAAAQRVTADGRRRFPNRAERRHGSDR